LGQAKHNIAAKKAVEESAGPVWSFPLQQQLMQLQKNPNDET